MLQSEFDAKLSPPKSFCLSIPDTSTSTLTPPADDLSFKSFRPDEEETDHEVELKILERNLDAAEKRVEKYKEEIEIKKAKFEDEQ